jgi:hypothetical protein
MRIGSIPPLPARLVMRHRRPSDQLRFGAGGTGGGLVGVASCGMAWISLVITTGVRKTKASAVATRGPSTITRERVQIVIRLTRASSDEPGSSMIN